MRAASRESLARLRAEWSQQVSGGQELIDLARELRQTARLLASEPGLRRAVADPARTPEARADLANDLFAPHVSPVTLRVLDAVVRSRWSSAVDLVNAVELLAVDVELESIAGSGGDGLVDVEDELFRFSQTVIAHPELAKVLGDNGAPVAGRLSVVEDLLNGKARPVTIRLIGMALEGLGGRNFVSGLSRLVEFVAARRAAQVAYVRTAVPLQPEQESRLTAYLAGVYGRQVSLKVRVDPSVIGGAIVKVGDDRYDGSVATRLERARTVLTER